MAALPVQLPPATCWTVDCKIEGLKAIYLSIHKTHAPATLTLVFTSAKTRDAARAVFDCFNGEMADYMCHKKVPSGGYIPPGKYEGKCCYFQINQEKYPNATLEGAIDHLLEKISKAVSPKQEPVNLPLRLLLGS